MLTNGSRSSMLTLEKSPKPAEVIPPHSPFSKTKIQNTIKYQNTLHKKYEFEILAEEFDKTQHHQPTLLACLLLDLFVRYVSIIIFTCIGVILELPNEFLLLRHFEPFFYDLLMVTWYMSLKRIQSIKI